MKLFISWSGEFSRKVTERLSIWIQIILQNVDVFYSSNDIEMGEIWNSRLSEELEQSNFGIVCLTPENVTAPWIHFEAGALSKATNSRVSAIMLGINPSDVKGPLARLQNTTCIREDFFHLFNSINKFSDKPLKSTILKTAFDNSWENLINDINPIIKEYTSPILNEKHSDNSGALQEILRLVRDLDSKLYAPAIVADSNLNKSSTGSDKYNVIIFISCPEEFIDKALPIIHRYIRDPEDMEDVERILRVRHTCPVIISGYKVTAFSNELYGVSPRIKTSL